ncbi:MAG: hypothetical protein HQL53_13680, partial [Magnetococcales bacterium]|nr:hypothetical protein [Magnetococcales bacterium]
MNRQRPSFNSHERNASTHAEAFPGASSTSAVSADAAAYLKQVYAMLAASLFLAVAAGYVGMSLAWVAQLGI